MLCAVCGVSLPLPSEEIVFHASRYGGSNRTIRYAIIPPLFPLPVFTLDPTKDILESKELIKMYGYWVHDDCAKKAYELRGVLPYAAIVDF